MNTMERYVSTRIVPVAVVDNETELRHIGDLCQKYLPAIELTMRTPYAMTALEILKKDYSDIAVGAATILSPEQADKVASTGTDFLISPGFTPQLLAHCREKNYLYVPGVSSPAELEQCLLAGYKILKMFPAEVIGGQKWLKAMESVYKHTGVKFMPLGGITIENVQGYLEMSNVVCCGGSWICPKDLITRGDWKEIESRFAAAAKLIKDLPPAL